MSFASIMDRLVESKPVETKAQQLTVLGTCGAVAVWHLAKSVLLHCERVMLWVCIDAK